MLVADSTGVYDFADQLRSAASPYFKVNLRQLREAVVRGMGLGTVAGWEQQLLHNPQWRADRFDYLAFAERMAGLTGSWDTAQALWSIALGVRLDLDITQYPSQRQRPEKYLDVPYDVSAQLRGVDPQTVATDLFIILPEFFSGKGVENFRVDSAHWHRAPLEKPNLRPQAKARGRNTLVAKLKDATWTGGLFIYSAQDQQDDTQCRRNVTAALSRSLLAIVAPGVHCHIYWPEGYTEGGYRIVIRLSPQILTRLGAGSFPFRLPRQQGWHYVVEPGYGVHGPDYREGEMGGNFVDGMWLCDLYPNGQEGTHRVDLNTVKTVLLRTIYRRLDQFGVRFVQPLLAV
ncbi:hypothetical protein I5U59_00475 [Stenotrophomonas maltophilia]|nr:hypothetical protein [Stenotrophomonas maltophilia]ALA82592.1 hypothetical protein VN11_11200 [Stenotrophomonas maltophilia]MBH1475928.1 hypothetical protein [Stenotrophomonas maltophilia]MBH1501564.1 hypothetical protein [Stenotrophomonas maltophilia]MBH1784675.1 hypothetical protein [Stenotrophomonas maltophilia]